MLPLWLKNTLQPTKSYWGFGYSQDVTRCQYLSIKWCPGPLRFRSTLRQTYKHAKHYRENHPLEELQIELCEALLNNLYEAPLNRALQRTQEEIHKHHKELQMELWKTPWSNFKLIFMKHISGASYGALWSTLEDLFKTSLNRTAWGTLEELCETPKFSFVKHPK